MPRRSDGARPGDADLGERLLLLGTCNGWGKDLEESRRHFSFSQPMQPSAGAPLWESRLQLQVRERKVSFQIVSLARLWDWRLHPVSDKRCAKELRCDQRLSVHLTQDSQCKEVHGRNFHLRESAGTCVIIGVSLDPRNGIHVWYTRGAPSIAGPAMQAEERYQSQVLLGQQRTEAVKDWHTLGEIEPLRIVGRFSRWKLDANGLTLKPQGVSHGSHKWHEHRLCFRMRSTEVKFQIVSETLGSKWRLYPKRDGRKGLLEAGEEMAMSASIGSQGDGRGRCFKVREPFLSVVTLYIKIEAVRSDWEWQDVGSVADQSGDSMVAGGIRVWYSVEDTGLQVAIGRRELQCPPEPVSSLDRTILEIISNPDARRRFSVLQQNLPLVRALNGLVEQHVNTPVIQLADARVDLQTPAARVAIMLMLRPSTLIDSLEVFCSYLRYHLLAPRGPRFAHVFVFVDVPADAIDAGVPGDNDDDDLEEEEQEQEEEEDRLARWLDSANASDLQPLVTLLDGGGLASASASTSRRPAELDAKVRSAAAANELVAKQMLNMQRCLSLAEASGIDWLLCNLDADEAFVCAAERGVGELFAAVPGEIWQLQVLNHEAVHEEPEPPADFFLGCTLFKRNQLQLGESPTEEQRRCMSFWGSRTAAAAHAAQAARSTSAGAPVVSDEPVPFRTTEGYFTGYINGKYAVRVAACCEAGAYPEDCRCWSVPVATVARVDPEEACILHYHNCQGVNGLMQKYRARTEERWNNTKFHSLCQRLYTVGSTALGSMLRSGLVLRDGDHEEVAKQLRAGVLIRMTDVRDACREIATSERFATATCENLKH